MNESLLARIAALSRRERHVLRKVLNVPEDVGLAEFIERQLAEMDQQPEGVTLEQIKRMLRDSSSQALPMDSSNNPP